MAASELTVAAELMLSDGELDGVETAPCRLASPSSFSSEEHFALSSETTRFSSAYVRSCPCARARVSVLNLDFCNIHAVSNIHAAS